VSSRGGETSSSRHSRALDYGTDTRLCPGSLVEHGATAQQLRVEPVIVAQVEVGQPVARRADKKPVRRKAPRR
jgi:hypothetical protein